MTTIATFNINYLQYLDKTGTPSQALPAFAKDHKLLLQFYRDMLRTRLFDAKAVTLQRTGKLSTFPASLGQEATFVGVGHAMPKTDVFVPHYRDQGTMLIRGVNMIDIFRYWGGDERGSDFAIPKQDFPISIPVGSQGLHACGVAYAFKLNREARCAVTTCGDGATSQGDFYEALNFAGSQNLPVVFVVNNNQWAISVPRQTQSAAETLAQKAIAAGFEGIQVDGCDVIAVYDAVSKALDKARSGGGPTLIEAVNYRLCDHTTADDAKRYADPDEAKAAWEAEPLVRLGNYLVSQHCWSEQHHDELKKTLKAEIDQAAKNFVEQPPQPVNAIFDYMYGNMPADLKAQRDTLSGATVHG